MHPLLASRTRTFLYLLAWLPIAGLLMYPLYYSAGLPPLESAAVLLPLCQVLAWICLSSWYLCRVLPLGPGQFPRILQSHLAAAVVASFFWAGLIKGWGLLLSRWLPGLDGRLSSQIPALFVAGTLLYLLSVSLHYALLSFQGSREAETQTQAARLLTREAELKALKAQINPHFLFNSLNSISALTTVDPLQAREMCIKLSEFLRHTLRLGGQEMIAFSEEVALARIYLAVEQVRFGARLRFEERIDPGCENCPVPALLLQPLIENAIKHGVAGLIAGGTIRLEARRQDGRLHLLVNNDFDLDAPPSRKSGLGLANVRARLQARYDQRARLDLETNGGHFRAAINLPCE